MLQLVYISTATTAPTPEAIDAILAASRRNNVRCDVTGLLVSGGRRFLQVLEGPDHAVLGTYARIQADARHKAVVLLSCRTTNERAFGQWSMAHSVGGAAGDRDLRSDVAKLTAGLDDRTMQAHFTGFAEIHAKAA